WRADRCVDHRDSFATEDLVEGGAELAVTVVDQEAHSPEEPGEAEVARLLGDPGTGRISRATCQVDAAAVLLDEEEDVEAAERDRLDGKEVTREHARGLLAEEVAPARACMPRRRPQPSSEEQPADRARR